MIFDASAIIAFLRHEPVAESTFKLSSFGLGLAEPEKSIATMRMEIVPFDLEQSHYAAGIHVATRSYGLSLGDCVCLQLVKSRGLSVRTADRAWAEIDLNVEVRLIRGANGGYGN